MILIERNGRREQGREVDRRSEDEMEIESDRGKEGLYVSHSPAGKSACVWERGGAVVLCYCVGSPGVYLGGRGGYITPLMGQAGT